MTEKLPTMESFLEDVKDHGMFLKMDVGTHRHIVCQKPSEVYLWFEIVTWPMCLTISGDMGTYVFRRVEDMFTFFRHDEINPDYWSSKLESVCRTDGFEGFSHDVCKQEILDYISGERDCVKEQVQEEIIDMIEDGESEEKIRDAIYDFENTEICLQDFVCQDFKEYKYRFIWCLYAIIWTIKRYDAFKQKLTDSDNCRLEQVEKV